ncbi:hypothetical protein HKBW3S09_01439 [Candidatus Hakubella thermalkaliphila]|uniref:Uncharacterized protein n=1 Tax=Candidatus Hakubella thermalkaliphila TaxID=2754717 RepID=A0A6V8NVA3_9ACTN|nr:hypothetical protein HKBW3S09_01439 [Candidatus Hakubella thermalkaliphila]
MGLTMKEKKPLEPLAKVVIRVKTGIQKGHNYLKRLGSCLRRNDKKPFLRTFARASCDKVYTWQIRIN